MEDVELHTLEELRPSVTKGDNTPRRAYTYGIARISPDKTLYFIPRHSSKLHADKHCPHIRDSVVEIISKDNISPLADRCEYCTIRS